MSCLERQHFSPLEVFKYNLGQKFMEIKTFEIFGLSYPQVPTLPGLKFYNSMYFFIVLPYWFLVIQFPPLQCSHVPIWGFSLGLLSSYPFYSLCTSVSTFWWKWASLRHLLSCVSLPFFSVLSPRLVSAVLLVCKFCSYLEMWFIEVRLLELTRVASCSFIIPHLPWIWILSCQGSFLSFYSEFPRWQRLKHKRNGWFYL